MPIARRVFARLRRDLVTPAAWRSERWFVLRVPTTPGAELPKVPLRLWAGRRLGPLDHRLPAVAARREGRSMPRLALLLSDAAGLAVVGRHPFALDGVREVSIEVARWRAPIRGWVGRLGPIRELRRSEVRVPAFSGRVRITIELVRERPLREVLAAVEGVLLPAAPIPVTHTASLGSQGRLPAWVPMTADVATRFVVPPGFPIEAGLDPVSGMVRGPEDPPPNRPPVDAELVMDGIPDQGLGLVATPRVEVSAAGMVSQQSIRATARPMPPTPVLVDVRGRHQPWAGPGDATGHVVVEVRADASSARWRARRAAAPVGPWRDVADVPGPGTWATDWSSASWDVAPDARPDAAALAVVNAALTGVVQDGRAIPPAVRGCIASELLAVMDQPMPPAGDPLAWERRSVRQRRAVVRGHATSLRAGTVLRPGAAVPASLPSVTALLVTRRPELAADALRAMELQTYPHLEVVLALHGASDDPALARRVAASPLPVELVSVPAAATLGEALGVATARARGSLVTKVDDDDVYGPEHVWDLVVARAVSGATVVGKPAQFVFLERHGITVRRDRPSSDVFGRVVAGGTILLARGELEAMGGWRPVRAGVDRALLDRVLHAGGTIYQTWPFGFVYRRHGQAHTWDVSDGYFLRSVVRQWQGIPDLPEFGMPVGVDPSQDVNVRIIDRCLDASTVGG